MRRRRFLQLLGLAPAAALMTSVAANWSTSPTHVVFLKGQSVGKTEFPAECATAAMDLLRCAFATNHVSLEQWGRTIKLTRADILDDGLPF